MISKKTTLFVGGLAVVGGLLWIEIQVATFFLQPPEEVVASFAVGTIPMVVLTAPVANELATLDDSELFELSPAEAKWNEEIAKGDAAIANCSEVHPSDIDFLQCVDALGGLTSEEMVETVHINRFPDDHIISWEVVNEPLTQ
ncbi:hypothetical protein H7X87_01035 [Acetobacteraceae bacterium]|nr:hypothetical protein [Candidatus Parcubacteria bacterium]